MAVVQSTTRGTFAELLSDAREQLSGFCAAVEPGLLETTDAAQLLVDAAELSKLASAAAMLLAPRAAESDAWRAAHERSAGHWLARLLGTSKAEADRVLDTGGQVQGLDATCEQLRRGSLSSAQAHEVVAGATAEPSAEDDLLESAARDQLFGLRNRSARARAGADRSPQDTHALHAARRACRHRHADGSESIEIRDTPDRIADLWSVAEPIRDELFRDTCKEGRREPAEAYWADAFSELGRRYDTGGTARRSRKPKFIVLADLAALRRGHLHSGEVCEIPGVGPYPLHRAREQLGDAVVHLVLRHGTELSTVVTSSRHVAAAVQSALEADDPECCEEGCNTTWGLENDHIASAHGYADTGITDFAGLRRRCRPHHRDRTNQTGRYDPRYRRQDE